MASPLLPSLRNGLRVANRLPSPNLAFYRVSTSGAINKYNKFKTIDDAKLFVTNLQEKQREFLVEALRQAKLASDASPDGKLSRQQVRALFVINFAPFIGFGFFDNFIMIVAGEYIDQSIGAVFTISTMAAAALGNTISDVAGIGLASYVELFANKLGIRHPVLTAAQLEGKKARNTSSIARASGLVVGCIIGMCPLLFF